MTTYLRRIMTWPRRRWRSRGFGIHSPFAYSFVTEVLAKKGGRLPVRCSSYLNRKDVTAAMPDAANGGITVVEAVSELPLHDNGSAVYIISHIDKGANKAFWRQLTETAPSGMDFSDYRTGVICRFPHLPRQSFKIVVRE